MSYGIYESQRLRLRPLTMEDLPEVAALLCDERVASALYCGVQPDTEAAAGVLRGYLSAPECYPFAVLERQSGAFAGVFLLKRYGERDCEETVYLGPAFWGQGYATELIARSFSMAVELLDAEEIVNYVKLDNTASVRAQNALGFHLDHVEYYDNCPKGLGIFRRRAASGTIRTGRWRHFKGGEYQVLGTARHSETGEELVVYRALYGDYGLWVRPAAMWQQTVLADGSPVPRFTYLGEI